MAGGQLWRVYTTRGADRTVEVAQQQTVRQEIATSAALGAAAPILIVLPLSWLVVGWAMSRVLGRLDTLAHDLAARSAAAAAPIGLAGIPEEVVPLVASMNGLILRLREAVDTQKRFLADAAHELRTPLAAMQIQVDSLDPAGVDARLGRVAALANGVRRASALISQLLRLARLDAPAPPSAEAVDLGPILAECVGDHVVVAHAKGIEFALDTASPLTCVAAAEELRVLIATLLDNAVRYTPPGGTIEVSLQARDGEAAIEILDTGPGLPVGAEARVFDRFYRAAPPEVEGTGLGLAIARRIAERHGFGLSVGNRADGVSGVVARVGMRLCSDADGG